MTQLVTCCMCGKPAAVGYCQDHDDQNGIEWDDAVDDNKRLRAENAALHVEAERLRVFAMHCIEAYQDNDPNYRHDHQWHSHGRFVALWAYIALTGERGNREDILKLQKRNRTKFTPKEEFINREFPALEAE